jgi:hypothetical protein
MARALSITGTFFNVLLHIPHRFSRRQHTQCRRSNSNSARLYLEIHDANAICVK